MVGRRSLISHGRRRKRVAAPATSVQLQRWPAGAAADSKAAASVQRAPTGRSPFALERSRGNRDAAAGGAGGGSWRRRYAPTSASEAIGGSSFFLRPPPKITFRPSAKAEACARVQPTNFRAASASDEAPSSGADVTAVSGAARTSNEPSARKGPRRLAKNSPSSGGNERRRASRSVGSMSLRTARAAVRDKVPGADQRLIDALKASMVHWPSMQACAEIKILWRDRRGARSMAWRCRFLTARRSQDARVIAEK